MPKVLKDNLPAAITNLKLSAALNNCGAIGVAESFDVSSADYLYVYDDRDLGYTNWTDLQPEYVSKCFIASNRNNKPIVLLPLDGRILTGPSIIKGGVCDGMLLTEVEMCFVEFKTNVTSSNNQTIIQRANEAIGQLWHTYNGIIKPRCENLHINIEQLLLVDFYVVFDKNLKVTGANSELMDLQVQFLEDNYHPLFFDNKKAFI